MNYEKLTLDRFSEKLKNGQYADATGARRALGKIKGWSTKDMTKAQELVNSNRSWAKPGADKPKAAKAAAAPKAAKKNAQPKAQPTAKRTYTRRAAAPEVPPPPSSSTRSSFGGEEEMRLQAYSNTVAALAPRVPSSLNDLEQRAYLTACVELDRLGVAESREKVDEFLSLLGLCKTTDGPKEKSEEGADAMPRIKIPNGEHLTGEARVQHESMAKAARAAGLD